MASNSSPVHHNPAHWQSRPGGKVCVQQKKKVVFSDKKMRDFSPALITGGKAKSRSHLPVIPNGWLKRTSGDFPLAEEQTRGCRHPSSLLLECPSFLPLNPSTVFFFSCTHGCVLRGTPAGRCKCCYTSVLKNPGINGD